MFKGPIFSISVATEEHEVQEADACYKAACEFLMYSLPKFRTFKKLETCQIKNVTSQHSRLFIGRWNGKVVTTAYIEKRIDGSCLLLHVSVHPLFQHKGIASLMLHACYEWAVENKASHIIAEVYDGNVNAYKLYESCGYKQTAFFEIVEDDDMPFHVYTKSI